MAFTEIAPSAIEGNVFELIGKRWMLITAGNGQGLNTMTASWGGLGVLWGKNVATCYIRPQRHTLGFVEREDFFTLSFFAEGAFRQELTLCGTKSGRDTDKVSACGFTPLFDESGAPYFDEAELVLVCRKLYIGDIDPKRFLDPAIMDCYPENDFHRVFIGEITKVLLKKQGD